MNNNKKLNNKIFKLKIIFIFFNSIILSTNPKIKFLNIWSVNIMSDPVWYFVILGLKKPASLSLYKIKKEIIKKYIIKLVMPLFLEIKLFLKHI